MPRTRVLVAVLVVKVASLPGEDMPVQGLMQKGVVCTNDLPD